MALVLLRVRSLGATFCGHVSLHRAPWTGGGRAKQLLVSYVSANRDKQMTVRARCDLALNSPRMLQSLCRRARRMAVVVAGESEVRSMTTIHQSTTKIQVTGADPHSQWERQIAI